MESPQTARTTPAAGKCLPTGKKTPSCFSATNCKFLMDIGALDLLYRSDHIAGPTEFPNFVTRDIYTQREMDEQPEPCKSQPSETVNPDRRETQGSDTAAASLDSEIRDTPEQQDGADENPSLRSSTVPKNSGILYRVVMMEGTSRIFRYSWTPFKGVNRDDDAIQARRELSVLDVSDTVWGESIGKQPQSQLRSNFEEQEDQGSFDIEKVFKVQSYDHTGIRIHSPCIQSVLRSLILYYPGFDAQSDEMMLASPFRQLFHYWDDLQFISSGEQQQKTQATNKNPDTGTEVSIPCTSETYQHLNILLGAPPLERVHRKLILPELKLHSEGKASYNMLWLLFKPGGIVFTKIRGKLAGFVVMNVLHISNNLVTYPEINPLATDRWELSLWNLVYRNGKLGRQSHRVYINRFHAERCISDLPAFPTRCAENQEELRAELIKRGKRYYDIICDKQSHMRYNGPIISEKPYHYEGEIIVDHQSYKLEKFDSYKMEIPEILGEEPQDLSGEPLFSKFNNMECSRSNDLQPAQYLLLPNYVLGFALEKREWDLGTEEVQMEKRLMKWLDRATIWGAIVLIDEAEVYLEQRQAGSISRNALVTGMPTSSRTHRLTDGQRKAIWRSLFDKLDEDQPDGLAGQKVSSHSRPTGQPEENVKPRLTIPQSTRDVALSKDSYPANFQLNGRDIRNILLLAISLARFEALSTARYGKLPVVIKVKAEQLQKVLKNKEEFNEDYKRATGFYPDQMAADRFMRSESAAASEQC
ncbi:hypothetical protein AK830_g8977 [Neonectria ditissima]|uniref:Uncharacterized protein n=1 Tax=Neonectria ditissima TaxID=78410 RepID=A0A0P7BAN6_9HYPO|nr:hypothetical protein AK830_g8977 [Neonectria ditissima]